MRKKTTEKRKKALKHKAAINSIIRENGIDKSLSTAEKNKLILASLNKSTESLAVEESTEGKAGKISTRAFRCECGIEVKLEGDVAIDMTINKCSKCRI